MQARQEGLATPPAALEPQPEPLRQFDGVAAIVAAGDREAEPDRTVVGATTIVALARRSYAILFPPER